MVVHASEKAEAVLVRFPHILKLLKFVLKGKDGNVGLNIPLVSTSQIF